MESKLIVTVGLTHGMCVTQITLQSGESTENHYHKETTEVYMISAGIGTIQCGNAQYDVGPNSHVVIEPRTFHQVTNTGSIPLILFSSKNKPYQYKDYYTES